MRVENLYDTLYFEKKETLDDSFLLQGDFGCEKEQNTIYKAYQALSSHHDSTKLQDFFKSHSIRVDKNIPEFAGLGGGSSNAAAFLRLTNRILALNISDDTLAKIGAKIGADVPFFVYNYASANVSGIGEVVKEYEEAPLVIETFTPDILCDTGKVYAQFREKYLEKSDVKSANMLIEKASDRLLKEYDAIFLNDLFSPAVDIYPALKSYHDNNFFSGSGSTFFRSIDG